MSETQPPATDPAQGQPPADPPANPPAAPPADPNAGTDWKAEARKWEQRAKENNKAATELEQLRAASMSEQEKAVAAAEKRGRTAAAIETGKRLASAELRAAAATKGLDLTEIGDLIDVNRFVDDKGEVDTDAIGKAVTKLAKATSAGRPPATSGGAFPGAPGAPPKPLDEQIADAEKAGDHALAIRLKRQRYAASQ